MRLFNKLINNLLGDKFKDKDLNELLKGGFSALILKVGGMILGYAIMIFLTNTFGAKVYGEYALALTILSITALLPKFGLDTALVRILGEAKQYGDKSIVAKIVLKALLITLTIGLLISITIYLFSDDLALNFFKKPDIENELSVIKWIIIPYASLFLIAAYFQAYKRIIFYILFNATLLNIVFFTVLIVFKSIDVDMQPFTMYGLSVLITFIIAVTFLLFNLLKSKNLEKKLDKIKDFTFREIASISTPMLLSSSFVLLINWLDVIMLGIFSSEQSIGIYNASLRLATISGIALFAINSIATPKFVEFYSKNDFKGLESMVKKSTKLIFFTTAPILLIFILFPKSILSINGSEFRAGYLALVFLCLGKFYNSICGSVGFILQMTDNQKIFQNVLLFAALLNAMLNYLLIPKYGFNGAAFASLITVLTWNTILVVIIKKKLGFWTVYIPLINKKI